MSTLATELPVRRADLVIQPIGEEGRYVVKVPGTHDYFHLGEEEHFLLLQLDGQRDAETVCAAFETKFGEPLDEGDLDGFVEIARKQQLLQEAASGSTAGSPSGATNEERVARGRQSRTSPKQSILYWRTKVFDPDRFFTWLEPKIRFFWTRTFLVVSASCIVAATLVLLTNGQQAVSSFQHALRWETLFFAWLTVLAVGTLHEFAHGLTCKHYGGEVREIGFLLMYFMPCYYCNVSDAWLFREKSKRLWVTFAGGYFELFSWALAVFVWRLTMPDTLINYLAFIVLTISGIDSLFNFNPLIKLDGYYLLSDWTEIPNLRQRSLDYAMRQLRRLLWGGPPPEAQPRGRFLLGFGLTSWLYSLTFLVLMLVFMRQWLSPWLGVLGLPVVAVLGFVSVRGLLCDLFREEFLKMLWQRHRRTAMWTMSLAGVVACSFLIPWTDQAGGDFEIRARTHTEIRAPVAGFLHRVHYNEGDQVTSSCEIAQLAVPDLASQVTRKQAEVREAEAKLRLLEVGPRTEEVEQQRRRVKAAQAWRDVAARNLRQQELALEQELIRFDELLQQCRAECDFAQQVLDRNQQLRGKKAISEAEYTAATRSQLVACAKRKQTEAERQSRAARGTLAAESELAEREKELAHEQATLALLEVGTRPEEISAAQASVERLREELSYLKDVRSRLSIRSRVRVCPIVREPDGLAMSSRNAYLSDGQRRQALALSASLTRAAEPTTTGIDPLGAGRAASLVNARRAAVRAMSSTLVRSNNSNPIVRPVLSRPVCMPVSPVATQLTENNVLTWSSSVSRPSLLATRMRRRESA